MIYRMISSKTILDRVMRDFKPSDGNWIADAYEWMAEVMENFDISPVHDKSRVEELEIVGHKAALPCDLRYVIGVEYDGWRLPYGGDLSGHSLIRKSRTTSFTPLDTGDNTEVFQAKTGTLDPFGTNIEPVSGNETRLNMGRYYQLNPDYIITSFETGTIKLFFEAFYTDKYGLPMIPDIYQFKEAAVWFIISRMLLGGYKLADGRMTFDYADNRWEKFKRMAINRAKFPSIDQMETFRRMWVRAIPKEGLPDQFFMNNEVPEQISLG